MPTNFVNLALPAGETRAIDRGNMTATDWAHTISVIQTEAMRPTVAEWTDRPSKSPSGTNDQALPCCSPSPTMTLYR